MLNHKLFVEKRNDFILCMIIFLKVLCRSKNKTQNKNNDFIYYIVKNTKAQKTKSEDIEKFIYRKQAGIKESDGYSLWMIVSANYSDAYDQSTDKAIST